MSGRRWMVTRRWSVRAESAGQALLAADDPSSFDTVEVLEDHTDVRPDGRGVEADGQTQRTAGHVLWHYGLGGTEPGSFVRALLGAIAAADMVNRRALAEVYPLHVKLVDLLESAVDGADYVRELAGPYAGAGAS